VARFHCSATLVSGQGGREGQLDPPIVSDMGHLAPVQQDKRPALLPNLPGKMADSSCVKRKAEALPCCT